MAVVFVNILSTMETVVQDALPAGRPVEAPAASAAAMFVTLARMKLPAAFSTVP